MRWRSHHTVLMLVLLACEDEAPTVVESAPPAPSVRVAPAPSLPPAGASDLVTHASPAWTSGPPVLAKDSVDGEALRARVTARLRGDDSPVVIVEGASAREIGESLCESVVPKRDKATPILLKPNLGGFDWFKDPKSSGGDDGLRGRITDPEFVRGVIRCLKKRGHTKITVAEGWGATHADWQRLIAASGYEAMTKEEGVPLVAMDDDGVFDVADDRPGQPLAVRGMASTHTPNLMMPKILAEHLDHGLFISLPKAKAHRFAVFSAGIKGAQGVVMTNDAAPAFRQKWRMHKELNPWLAARKKSHEDDRAGYVAALEAFADRMVDVTAVAAPHVVLVDAAPAMGGDGFQKLYPLTERPVGIGGTNVVRVDRVVAQWLGLWDNADLARELGGHRTSPLLERAAAYFSVDLDTVTLSPESRAILSRPRPVHFIAMAPFALHTEVRSSKEPPIGESPAATAVHLRPGDSVKIDGDGSDAAWARATPVKWSTDWEGHASDVATSARFLWSSDALYVLVEISSAGLHADATRSRDVDRPKLYEEDCVELFLGASLADRDHYYEIEVGPFGQFLDLDVQHAQKKSDVAWSSKPTIATRTDAVKHTATIELSLKSPDVLALLVPGVRLPLGLYRMEGTSPRQYLAWSPTRTPKPNFHVPAAFGTLTIER
ncbi:MAG: DUF362 domain-containing protein [Polyangiales bacterium]